MISFFLIKFNFISRISKIRIDIPMIKMLYGQDEIDTISVDDTFNLCSEFQWLPKGENIPFYKDELMKLCELAKYFLLKDETVIRIKPHVHVVGDIQGQYNYVWKFIKTNETTDKFLFLGDYVNHGKNSIEVLALVLSLKVIHPDQVFLLRGCQETPEKTVSGGFKEECLDRYDEEVYNKFMEVFDCLPLAAIISDDQKSIFCVNGGITSELKTISQLEEIERPLKIPPTGLIHDILYANPRSSKKNNGCVFGPKMVHRFLKNNKLDSIIRSHQCQKGGYNFPFGFDDQSVVSIFSCPHYDKEHRVGAAAYVRDSMLYTIKTVA